MGALRHTLIAAAAAAWAGPAAAGPERIVSLDYCADAYVLALAAPGGIAALSPDATQPFAYFHERARAFPRHKGSAEEILTLDPGLVVRSGYGSGRLDRLLDRFGIATLDIGFSEGLDDARAAVAKVGRALDRMDEAAALLARMQARLDRLGERRARLDRLGSGPRAYYFTPSGITSGAGTYVDQVFALAGVENLLAAQGVEGWSSLTLEGLAAHPPDVMVTSFFDTRPGWSAQWRISRHPVAERLLEDKPRIAVPAHHWGCAGFFLVDAAEAVIAGRADWQRARTARAARR